MSPLAIQMMLHCYCSREPWRNVPPIIWNSDASREARAVLVRDGMLDVELRPTEDGSIYVERLCAIDPTVRMYALRRSR